MRRREFISLLGGAAALGVAAALGELGGDTTTVVQAAARVTPAHVFSKTFSEKAYSIGLGGLGDKLDDYFTLMGEMITIGGTMVPLTFRRQPGRGPSSWLSTRRTYGTPRSRLQVIAPCAANVLQPETTTQSGRESASARRIPGVTG